MFQPLGFVGIFIVIDFSPSFTPRILLYTDNYLLSSKSVLLRLREKPVFSVVRVVLLFCLSES